MHAPEVRQQVGHLHPGRCVQVKIICVYQRENIDIMILSSGALPKSAAVLDVQHCVDHCDNEGSLNLAKIRFLHYFIMISPLNFE